MGVLIPVWDIRQFDRQHYRLFIGNPTDWMSPPVQQIDFCLKRS